MIYFNNLRVFVSLFQISSSLRSKYILKFCNALFHSSVRIYTYAYQSLEYLKIKHIYKCIYNNWVLNILRLWNIATVVCIIYIYISYIYMTIYIYIYVYMTISIVLYVYANMYNFRAHSYPEMDSIERNHQRPWQFLFLWNEQSSAIFLSLWNKKRSKFVLFH